MNLLWYRVFKIEGDDAPQVLFRPEIQDERRVCDQEDNLLRSICCGIACDFADLLHKERLVLRV